MYKRLSNAVVLIFLTALSAAFAQAAPVEANLVARVVTQDANGKEKFSAASTAKPGDVVDYQVTYSNTTNAAMNNVVATLPIPAGSMVYLPRSAKPASVLASTDGHTFAPAPLIRTVRKADGSTATENIPLSEYRFLRWNLEAIAAGKTAIVSARMQVIDTTTISSENAVPGVSK